MKIASCILSLNIAVYMGVVGCSSSVPGPLNPPPVKWFQWVDVKTHGHQVRVKKNPFTKQLVAIELEGQPPLKAVPGQIRRLLDYANDLDFVAQVNPDTGDWIAVAPMTPAYEALIPHRPVYKLSNPPKDKHWNKIAKILRENR